MLYNKIEDVPKWAKPTIKKLIDKGAFVGNEKGELMLTYDMLRMYVSHDNIGVYDR
jgi:N-acetylmuramoyl-L-alanine amidase